jgi:hypothetical protein
MKSRSIPGPLQRMVRQLAMSYRHPNWRTKNVTILYERLRQRKGHSVAVGAVARHLSEAAFWMRRKQEPYKDPARKVVTRGKGQREANMVKVKP